MTVEPSEVLLLLPTTSESSEMLNFFDICISFPSSGIVSPLSHFWTDCLVTSKSDANCS